MRAFNEIGRPDLRLLALSERSQILLARPIRGDGGFQRVLRRLQAAVEGDVLVAPLEDIQSLIRLCAGRAKQRLGGFQQVTMSLLVDIWRNERACPEFPTAGQQTLPFDHPAPRRPRPDWRVIRGRRL